MQKEFLIITCFLAALSIQAIANAIQVTLINIKGRIYIETDPEHYAMYGQITDDDGIRIVVLDGNRQKSLTAKCEVERRWLDEINEGHLKAYKGLRDNYFKFVREDPAAANSISWSANLSEDQKGFSLIKPGGNVLVFSSAYFPDHLARVIIDGEVVIFVYFDGRIVMKTMKCLYPYEQILIRGIKRINTSDGMLSRFASKDDQAMVKYLKSHPINVEEFKNEQLYLRPYTKEEQRQIAESNRKAQMAIMGAGSRVFDGHW